MPATYEPIATTTLGTDTQVVTFSSIPGTYTDLVLVIVGRNSTAGSGSNSVLMTFNSDTGSNYSNTFLTGNGSTASSSRLSSFANLRGQGVGQLSSIGTSTVHIMSYANTNVFKTVLGARTTPGDVVNRSVGLWRSTSAITSISMDSDDAGFKADSTFCLYGIKAA